MDRKPLIDYAQAQDADPLWFRILVILGCILGGFAILDMVVDRFWGVDLLHLFK